jgi:hypothetical protein
VGVSALVVNASAVKLQTPPTPLLVAHWVQLVDLVASLATVLRYLHSSVPKWFLVNEGEGDGAQRRLVPFA